MSASAEQDRAHRADRVPAPLAVDRVACSGHGVCAQLLAGVTLDEWGYPIVDDAVVARRDGAEAVAAAVRLCPARALYRR